MEKIVLVDSKKIEDAFEAIGLGVMEFGHDFEKIYSEYKWYLIHHWRVGEVVYAVPPVNALLKKPWESWYLDSGVGTHHVHYAEKIHEDDNIWIQKEWTEERPDEIIGTYWFWYNDKGMKPVLLQV